MHAQLLRPKRVAAVEYNLEGREGGTNYTNCVCRQQRSIFAKANFLHGTDDDGEREQQVGYADRVPCSGSTAKREAMGYEGYVK